MAQWRWWRRWRSARSELDEEMVFHLDRLTEDLIQQGYPPSEARREAVRRFGSREHVHSRSRVESGFALMVALARNVRFALRGIRRAPLHATIFVLTTALTVALGGLAWAVGDATLWRELPYPEPDRLVQVAMYDAEASTHPTITLAGVVTALAGLTVVASFVPAARVARLDPARVLREE